MKKVLTLVLVALLAISLVACGGGGDGGSDKIKVGVSMPTKGLQRWIQDGDYLKAEFEKAGYEVDLQYGGDNVVAEQVSQVENMIAGGCKVLVIAAIDADSLSGALAPCVEQEIAVIAYDRLINNSDAISYYASFDNVKVGRCQGEYIEQALDLKNAEGPFNLEIFTGAIDDTNAAFFYKGAMDVLQQYIDSGVLVVPSGQTSQAQTATEGWSAEKAQARMENLLSAQKYGPTSGTKLHAVLCSNDSTAQGSINALVAAGYDESNIPVITGQDCDKPNVGFMLKGLQGVSIFKDTRTLAAQTVKMVNQIINGEEVDVNDTTTYNNKVKDIPSFLCDPVPCTKGDIQKMLFDSGYYTTDDPDFADFIDLL